MEMAVIVIVDSEVVVVPATGDAGRGTICVCVGGCKGCGWINCGN